MAYCAARVRVLLAVFGLVSEVSRYDAWMDKCRKYNVLRRTASYLMGAGAFRIAIFNFAPALLRQPPCVFIIVLALRFALPHAKTTSCACNDIMRPRTAPHVAWRCEFSLFCHDRAVLQLLNTLASSGSVSRCASPSIELVAH